MNAVLGERFAPCSRLTPRRAGLEGFARKNARFWLFTPYGLRELKKLVNFHPSKNNELRNCCLVSFLQRKHSVLMVLRFLSSQPLLL